jgi:hypothetical protein
MPMKRRDKIQLLIFAVSAIGYFPFSEWVSTTRIGTAIFLWGQTVYLFPLMAAVLAIPVLSVGLVRKRTRRQASFFLMLSLVLAISCAVGIIAGQKLRTAGMRSFAERSQSLITAIEKYQRHHSAPPRSLHDLVPNYLPKMPSTGMMAYPQYHYYVGDEAKQRYGSNPWVLSVPTPSGGINFDEMLYFPNQNYPEKGYGGWLEQVGEWAYVHE